MDDVLTISGMFGLAMGTLLLVVAILLTLILAVLHLLDHPAAQHALLSHGFKWSWLSGAILLLVGTGLCGLKWHFYPFYLT